MVGQHPLPAGPGEQHDAVAGPDTAGDEPAGDLPDRVADLGGAEGGERVPVAGGEQGACRLSLRPAPQGVEQVRRRRPEQSGSGELARASMVLTVPTRPGLTRRDAEGRHPKVAPLRCCGPG